jgi:hypothetical protein
MDPVWCRSNPNGHDVDSVEPRGLSCFGLRGLWAYGLPGRFRERVIGLRCWGD